jgi:hypothetical protein
MKKRLDESGSIAGRKDKIGREGRPKPFRWGVFEIQE